MSTDQVILKIERIYTGKDEGTISDEEKNILLEEVRRLIADELDCDPSEIREDALFIDIGLDSIAILQIFDEIKKLLKLSVPTGQILTFAKKMNLENLSLKLTSMIDLIVLFLEKQGKVC